MNWNDSGTIPNPHTFFIIIQSAQTNIVLLIRTPHGIEIGLHHMKGRVYLSGKAASPKDIRRLICWLPVGLSGGKGKPLNNQKGVESEE
jgi:hypothetical protein